MLPGSGGRRDVAIDCVGLAGAGDEGNDRDEGLCAIASGNHVQQMARHQLLAVLIAQYYPPKVKFAIVMIVLNIDFAYLGLKGMLMKASYSLESMVGFKKWNL